MAGTAQGDRAGRDASGGPLGSRYNRRDRPVRRHPVRGAVARGGGHPGQSARRDRDRARHRGLRAHREWRSDRNRERVGGDSSRSDHYADCTAQTARGLLRTPLCRRRRIDLVWGESRRPIPASSRLRRSHPQGREAGRPAGAGADQIRNGAQPQDRQGARPRRACERAGARRRGDRMTTNAMRRRSFITLLGVSASAWPLAAGAQQPERVRRIGVLTALPENDPENQARLAAFHQGLERLGWTIGRNVRIDYRATVENPERARSGAAELLALQADIILANGSLAAQVLQQATRTVPVVFTSVSEPVAQGFAASLARPGGNMTG